MCHVSRLRTGRIRSSARVGHVDLTYCNKKRQIRPATRLQPAPVLLRVRSLHGGTDAASERAAEETTHRKLEALDLEALVGVSRSYIEPYPINKLINKLYISVVSVVRIQIHG